MQLASKTPSPERVPLITYKDRTKRKRILSNQSECPYESSIESNHAVLSKKDTDQKKVASEGSKSGNLDPSGPSPKAVIKDTKDSDRPKVKKARHVREASLSHAAKAQETPATTKKPQSSKDLVVRPRSKAKSVGEDDDNVSVADSTISTRRVRRNEAERIQYFENQPECGKIRPHQVHCMRCNKPVNLGRRRTYAVRLWEIHRVSCDQRPAHKSPSINGPAPTSEPVLPPAPAIVSQATPARRPSEQERKGFLESDNQIEFVEKHRVFCAKCQTWIDLGQTSSYATGNWVKHKVRCSVAVPSSRVAAAKRQLYLVNDSQAMSFDSRNVGCVFCGVNIELEGEGDFNLVKWNEHKSACNKLVHMSKNQDANSIPFPGHSPLSSASTENTLVGVGSGPPQGLKRPREEQDTLPVDEMPKPIRPRTESYLPPTMEPPNSILGWFMMPFQSFVRGFKESLMERP